MERDLVKEFLEEEKITKNVSIKNIIYEYFPN